MHFVALPFELRLKIYALVLLYDEPFRFSTSAGLTKRDSKLLVEPIDERGLRIEIWYWEAVRAREISQGLAPSVPRPTTHFDKHFDTSLLYVNRAIHYEAASFFYSKHTFIFGDGRYAYHDPDALDNVAVTTLPCFLSILHQLGPTNVSFLRHIQLPFPTAWDTAEDGNVTLHREYARILELIRTSCPSIKTLKLDCQDRVLQERYFTVEMLQAIDLAGPARMPSLSSIAITSGDSRRRFPYDTMMKMPGPRWSAVIEFAYVDYFVSSDRRFEFHQYHCLCRYHEQLCVRELLQAKGRELTEWPRSGWAAGDPDGSFMGTEDWRPHDMDEDESGDDDDDQPPNPVPELQTAQQPTG